MHPIDWVIVGGESGNSDARPFDLAWARELRDYCQKKGVACFIKQLGRNPVEDGQLLKLNNKHGGDWEEWPEDLRVREFPEAFYNYRSIPRTLTQTRPSSVKIKKTKKTEFSKEDIQRFKVLDATVRKTAKGLVDASMALAEINQKKLYTSAGYETFEDYCREVHNMSRAYAYTLMASGKTYLQMSTIVDKYNLEVSQLPQRESQLRELSRVKNVEKRCEILAEIIEEKGTEYTAADLADKVKVTLGNVKETGEPKPPSPRKRLDAARGTLIELEKALNEYEGMSEVRILLKSLRKNLG